MPVKDTIEVWEILHSIRTNATAKWLKSTSADDKKTNAGNMWV